VGAGVDELAGSTLCGDGILGVSLFPLVRDPDVRGGLGARGVRFVFLPPLVIGFLE